MHKISEEEKARRLTTAFEEIAEDSERLRAQQENNEALKKLKVREDARERQRNSRKRKKEREVDAGIRSEDLRLKKKPVCHASITSV